MAATPNGPTGGGNKILTSQWLGLNPKLIARFYPVNNKGSRIGQPQVEVWAPLVDSNIEAVFGWQSPFEQSSPDSKAPALTAMLQSGALLPVLNDTRKISSGSSANSAPPSNPGALQSAVMDFEGRTGITQLNSTQVFSGMPPIKITVSAYFRAFFDPQTEVEDPLQQLWSWALPQKLSKDSIVDRITSDKNGVADWIAALLPSVSPQMIGFQYKRRTYAPMVIESFGEPLSAPIDKDGFYTSIVIPMNICNLAALDKDDMRKIMTPNAN